MPANKRFIPLPASSPLSGQYTGKRLDQQTVPSPSVDATLSDLPVGDDFDYRQVLQIYREHAAAGISFLEMSLDAQMEQHGIEAPDPTAQIIKEDPAGAVHDLPKEPVDDNMLGSSDGQDTYYPNLASFVKHFMTHVFPYHQSATKPIKWGADWFKYPSLVFAFDAIWRGYEVARTRPGAMESWYFQTTQLLGIILNRDTGIIASLPVKECPTVPGQPLPCDDPSDNWRQNALAALAPTPPTLNNTNIYQTDDSDQFDDNI